VKVSAVSLNYRDLLLIKDGFGFNARAEPFVPASDAAGVVVMIGAAVTRFQQGDRVISTFIPGWIDGIGFGTAREPNSRTLGGAIQGVLSEYIALNQDWAVKAPESLNDAEASTLPRAGLTAWTALVERGKLHAGQTVVVQGTGGVALLGLQIAAAHGADVIVVSAWTDARRCDVAGQGRRHGHRRSFCGDQGAIARLLRRGYPDDRSSRRGSTRPASRQSDCGVRDPADFALSAGRQADTGE
jgi:NADPH:quinone reductase-like Zn-dependent oxidoreductase